MIELPASSKLFELTKTIRDNKKDFLEFKQREVHKRSELYSRVQGKIKEYNEGIKSMSWSSQYFIKDDIFWIQLDNYIARLNQKYPILDQTVTALMKQLQISLHEAKNNVGHYINFLLFHEKSDLPDERIIELISIFIKDLHKTPPDWNVKLWISGIWLNIDKIEIQDFFTIRKPNDNDLDFTSKPYTILDLHTPTFNDCHSIIEFSRYGVTSQDLENYIARIIKTLKLFRVGTVNIVKKELSSNSISQKHGFGESIGNRRANFKYELNRSDRRQLKNFISSLIDFFPSNHWQNEENEKNSIYISIDRYFEALEKPQSQESLITNIITCLESLFLKSYERSELSHKLSQRVSYLLTNNRIPPLKNYKTLKRAYDIRSTYIHGSMLKSDEKKDLKTISDMIINLARLSILYFIGFSEKYSKDELLTKIDNAILDNDADKKFKEELKNCTLISD